MKSLINQASQFASKWLNKQFISNVSLLGISNVLYSVSQWGILIFLTKLSDIDTVGQFSLSLAIVSPVMLFLGAGFKVFIATDVKKRFSFGDYLFTRVLASLLGFLIVLGIGIFNEYSRYLISILLFICLIKIVEAFQEVCWGISQRSHKMKSVGYSRILRAITSVTSVGIFLWIKQSLVLGLICWLLTWLLILVFFDLPAARHNEAIDYSANPKIPRQIISATLPLAIIAGLISLNEKVTVYQIAAYMGEFYVGFFSPLAYIVQGVSLGIKSINEASTPSLAVNFHSDKKAYKTNSLMIAGFGGIAGIVILGLFGAFRTTILPLVYSADFLEYADLFVIFLGIGVIRFILAGFGTSVTAAGYLKEQIPFWVISLIVTFSSGFILIPIFGLYGAAYSVASGLIVNLVLIVILWLKTIRLEANR